MRTIGIGTDIAEIDRIEAMAVKHAESFLTRVYTPDERAYCETKKQSAQHWAGRWAAKEAVLKALGTGWSEGIAWTDVEVRTSPEGKPSIRLSGGAKKYADSLGITDVLISISHCDTYAVAFACAVGE